MVTILGVSSMQGTTIQERMAGNTRQSHLSFHAAEAGIKAMESQLKSQSPSTPPIDCNGYIDTFFAGKVTPVKTELLATSNKNELPASYKRGYCGPMKKEFVDQGAGLSKKSFSEIYTVISVGSVGVEPNNIETRLVSTFAVEVN